MGDETDFDMAAKRRSMGRLKLLESTIDLPLNFDFNLRAIVGLPSADLKRGPLLEYMYSVRTVPHGKVVLSNKHQHQQHHHQDDEFYGAGLPIGRSNVKRDTIPTTRRLHIRLTCRRFTRLHIQTHVHTCRYRCATASLSRFQLSFLSLAFRSFRHTTCNPVMSYLPECSEYGGNAD